MKVLSAPPARLPLHMGLLRPSYLADVSPRREGGSSRRGGRDQGKSCCHWDPNLPPLPSPFLLWNSFLSLAHPTTCIHCQLTSFTEGLWNCWCTCCITVYLQRWPRNAQLQPSFWSTGKCPPLPELEDWALSPLFIGYVPGVCTCQSILK